MTNFKLGAWVGMAMGIISGLNAHFFGRESALLQIDPAAYWIGKILAVMLLGLGVGSLFWFFGKIGQWLSGKNP